MSISRISLKNFVIVPALDLEVPAQFTALTGETGAGKSILIDALQLALGQRADSSVVYEGAAQADIAVEFDATPAALHWLQAAGLDEGESILVRRTVDTQGKSRAWINGSAATLTQLRELGDLLVDIHGQHAWASLGKSSSAVHLLDAYARMDKTELHSAWQAWRQAGRTLAEAQAQQSTLSEERERLEWQLGEVAKLQPQADEWEPLNQEHSAQTHMQDLLDASLTALQALEGDEEMGATQSLHAALQALARIQHLQPQLALLHQQLAAIAAQADDFTHDLRSVHRHLQPDTQRLQELDARLSLWLSLARRYKTRPEDLPALVLQWQEKLAQLNTAADLDALTQAEAAALTRYQQAAQSIGRARALAAPKLAAAITQALQGLGMPGGQLGVQLAPCAPSEHGVESVEFLVAGHAGVTPRPLHKIASGGELSRIALAIAVITAMQEGAPTLIFDEVDSGIGGAVAHTVGQLMHQLGLGKQVLAVTHLAQVAAHAHHHLFVSKVQTAGKTSSRVQLLGAEPRVQEIARMLGGSTSAASLAHAQELLEQAA